MRDAPFEVTVGGEKFTFSTKSELFIDRDNLDDDLARQAALYAFFGIRLSAELKKEKAILEADYEELFNRLDQEVRPTFKTKPTETEIKNKIKTDPRIIVLSKKLTKLEFDEYKISIMLKALEQRKDMLKALSMNRSMERTMPSSDEIERMKSNLLGR